MNPEPRYYADVTKLHETPDVESANRLLQAGWELIGLKEKSISVVNKDGSAFTTEVSPVFILGFSRPADMGPAPGKEPVSQPQPRPPAPRPQTAAIEAKLEGLVWTPARSGRCDYVRNAPPELVEAVRSNKRGITGKEHHFTASMGEPVIFRFKRGVGGH